MFAFDVRTAFLIIGLFYLLLPTFTWVVLAGKRSAQIALWCGGGMLLGVSAVLSSLIDQLPFWVSIGLGSLVFVLAGFLRIRSLQLDLGKPWHWRSIVLSVLALSAVFLVLHYSESGPTLRAQFFSLVAAALFAHLSALAWRIGKNEQSPNANWIAWSYALVALAFVFRIFYLVFVDTTALPREGISARIVTMTMLISAVIGHLGYIGLHLDRSMRRELKAMSERARAEERHLLIEQIAQLDRSRALGEMAASLGHELNQPLTATLTIAQVTKRGLIAGRFDALQLTDFLDKIIHNTYRASQIIERIRNFIRPSQTTFGPVNLNDVVLGVLEMVADEVRNLQVHIESAGHLSPMLVKGDSIQLSQIILNVIRNAIEAMSQESRRELTRIFHHARNEACFLHSQGQQRAETAVLR